MSPVATLRPFPMGPGLPSLVLHLERQPPTPVTLGTNCQDQLQWPVKLVEVGVLDQVAHVRFETVSCILQVAWFHVYVSTSVAGPCGDPPTIPNGSRTFTGTTFGETATYTCNTGYQRSGSSTVTCQASGSWSTRPSCSRKNLNFITPYIKQKWL